MIAVDINVLARFYVDDPTDPDAALQRPIAHRVLSESASIFVPLTVLVELEWVVRACYDFGVDDFVRVVAHSTALPHVVVEGRPEVLAALDLHQRGLDFADALHLARSSHCQKFVTFDDRRFARRAASLGARPPVDVPR